MIKLKRAEPCRLCIFYEIGFFSDWSITLFLLADSSFETRLLPPKLGHVWPSALDGNRCAEPEASTPRPRVASTTSRTSAAWAWLNTRPSRRCTTVCPNSSAWRRRPKFVLTTSRRNTTQNNTHTPMGIMLPATHWQIKTASNSIYYEKGQAKRPNKKYEKKNHGHRNNEFIAHHLKEILERAWPRCLVVTRFVLFWTTIGAIGDKQSIAYVYLVFSSFLKTIHQKKTKRETSEATTINTARRHYAGCR